MTMDRAVAGKTVWVQAAHRGWPKGQKNPNGYTYAAGQPALPGGP